MIFIYYIFAAIFEILGCYLLYSILVLKKSLFLLPFSITSLGFFAYLLARIEIQSTGKIYTIYGGIYIIASVIWMSVYEKIAPSKFDILGIAIIMTGIFTMIYFNKV